MNSSTCGEMLVLLALAVTRSRRVEPGFERLERWIWRAGRSGVIMARISRRVEWTDWSEEGREERVARVEMWVVQRER